MKAIVVFITANSEAEADRLAAVLIEKKLAACVQILPQMISVYHWQGEIARDAEHLILVKTLDAKFAELEKTVRENHSYQVPEIVAVEAAAISDSYFEWIKETVE